VRSLDKDRVIPIAAGEVYTPHSTNGHCQAGHCMHRTTAAAAQQMASSWQLRDDPTGTSQHETHIHDRLWLR
jgi:hypothetical protein